MKPLSTGALRQTARLAAKAKALVKIYASLPDVRFINAPIAERYLHNKMLRRVSRVENTVRRTGGLSLGKPYAGRGGRRVYKTVGCHLKQIG